MAAKKSTRKKPRQAEAVPFLPDITIDEAFQLVVGHGGLSYPDRVLANAFANGDLPLWEGDNRVPPRFFASSLEVVAKPDDVTGRSHAEIGAIWNLDRQTPSSYDWRTSAKAVADFIARRPMAAKHAGGRPRKYSHEDIFIAAAVYLQHRCNPQPPTSTKLENGVALILGDGSPSEGHLGKILRPLLARLDAGLDPEMMEALKLI